MTRAEGGRDAELPRREDYARIVPIQTRWADNDVYGHVNNVVYYAYFDSAINRILVADGGLDPATSLVIGLCVESQCKYLAPVTYPEDLDAAVRVGKLGRSSVRYEVGIFRRAGPGDRAELCAFGHFVHVFVDRASRRPTPIEGRMRDTLVSLVVPVAP